MGYAVAAPCCPFQTDGTPARPESTHEPLPMDLLTARPENLLANVLRAGLMAGIPVGLVFAAYGLATHPIAAPDTWTASLGSVLLAPVFVLIAGVLLLPILVLLRRAGYAGPLFVYALSTIFGLVLLSSDLRAGLLGFALALPTSFVFCRYACD